MAKIERYEPGEFSWVDLLTPDVEGARAFYTGVFDWVTGEPSGPEGGGYMQVYCQDRAVLGMVGMNEPERASGVPAVWTSYVSVANADATAARAVELGGKLDFGVHDVFDLGRMAFVSDPSGARFCLWQARQHIGASLRNEPDSLCWNELGTHDAAAAQAFYGPLFGWTFRSSGGEGPGGYVEIFNAGRPTGGILPLAASAGAPAWLPYFAVADCDHTVQQIQARGGALHVPAQNIEPGRFAVAADPQGARFCVIQS